MLYEVLKKLMVAMIVEDRTTVKELKEELKEFLSNPEKFDKQEVVSDLIDAMYDWAEELRKARRFKNALLDFIDDEFQEVYRTIESRFEHTLDEVEKVYRVCKRYDY